MGSPGGDTPGRSQEIRGPGKGQTGSPGGQAACTRGQVDAPWSRGSRGGTVTGPQGTGSMHGGGSWGPRRCRVPGDRRHAGGRAEVPAAAGSPGRDGRGCRGGGPAGGGMRPPRLSRGRGRPALPARGRGGCGKAAGVRLGNRVPSERRARRGPRPGMPPPAQHPLPQLTFKQGFFFSFFFLASIWAKKRGVHSPIAPEPKRGSHRQATGPPGGKEPPTPGTELSPEQTGPKAGGAASPRHFGGLTGRGPGSGVARGLRGHGHAPGARALGFLSLSPSSPLGPDKPRQRRLLGSP